VERADSVSFVLMAPGYCLRDFKVKVVKDELRVEAPDFEVTRGLGCRVAQSGARADYRNGVFSLRIPKKS
jgi:HSP20 family molecular chaperone IbpA